MTYDDIYKGVATVLSMTLNINPEDITPTASLRNDLGIESIDYLDVLFRLEREFNIAIPRDDLFPESLSQIDPKFIQDGKITDEGLALIKDKLPFADVTAMEHDCDITNLITVGMISRYIDNRLNNPRQTQ